MKELRLALDWTPNINHLGFFVAKDLGYYEDKGLSVELVSPAEDNYTLTPAKKVELGKCDLTLCPTESIISYRTKKTPFNMFGIAAIYQRDLSAIVARSKGSEELSRPADLEGKRYASFQARYEDSIVRELIRKDGAEGTFEIEYPPKLGIWNTLINGDFDATWIFLNWEGADKKLADPDLRLSYFKLEDFGIPYSYSPILAASESLLTTNNEEALSEFVDATRSGYLLANEDPDKALNILQKHVPASDSDIDLTKALELSLPAFGTRETWGNLDPKIIDTFLDWLEAKDLEPRRLKTEEIITQKYL